VNNTRLFTLMETVLGMDQSKVELLDQVVRDLEGSFSDAPAGVQELAKNASSAVRLLRNSLKCKFSEHVAQLARDGNPDAASEERSCRRHCFG
jgi:hypothetical protein